MSAFTFLLCLFCVTAYASDALLGAYWVNWAQWRPKPYTYVASSLSGVASDLDRLMFSFVFFCPAASTSPMPYWAEGKCTADNEYSLIFVEDNDAQSAATITGMKASAPGMKVIMSVGGWNFPSHFFSQMVSTAGSRSKFISSVKDFLSAHNFDGIDIDWEYPCSEARTNPVKITCEQFRTVQDDGGNCPADTANIAVFFKELRAALPDASISMAGPADVTIQSHSNVGGIAQYLDYIHVMSYDYTVSDVPDGSTFSPNAPLYNPPAPAAQMSIDWTIQGYINAGVKSSQLLVGIPLYGHAWFNPTLNKPEWQAFGGDGKIQGQCCGPFKETYGARYGRGAQQCGLMMYSEIVAAGMDVFFDNKTQSNIGFLSQDSADGWTQAGTWVTYNDKDSIAAIVKYALDKKLAGAFVFDSSMDTLNYQTGEPTYEVTKAIRKELGGGGGGGSNVCDPAQGCTVCAECCKSYLKDQSACDQCVAAECPTTNICVPPGCNVCDACCKSYLNDQSACDGCVSQECKTAQPLPWLY